MEEQFDFRKGKGRRDAIGLIRTIGERYTEKNKDMYAVFVDLEKVLDRVDWKKHMGTLNKIDVHWKERRFLSNLLYETTNKSEDRRRNVRGKI